MGIESEHIFSTNTGGEIPYEEISAERAPALQIPLYYRFDRFVLNEGSQQTPDLETLQQMWEDAYPGEDYRAFQFPNVQERFPWYVAPPWEVIRIPKQWMFVEPQEDRYMSHHGAEHIGEVQLFGELAGQMLSLDEQQMRLLRIGLFLHDLRKKEDGVPCPGHGADAADWFEYSPEAAALRKEYDEDDMLVIRRLATLHDEKWTDVSPTIPEGEINIHRALRTADAWARWRIQIKSDHPDINRMPMEDKVMAELGSQFARRFILLERLFRLEHDLTIEDSLRYAAMASGLVQPPKEEYYRQLAQDRAGV